ncbi:hypothetical protein D1610_07570 [Sphingomonas gilva]|uniref:Uncharacterized protein n=1 Tax=Sphingomonas gilva TaxID=2305907 RepID=A0A396RQR7_9SPHN|nr:hypothetical protein [Sphingomonas gilva]RHW18316.1 hypothetical protein D1610_07570 [Sphingomonas gilva]
MASRPAQTEESTDFDDWTFVDLAIWKLVPQRLGGGIPYIQRYKDAWVRHHKLRITASATAQRLPPPLLAGVCWIEVGGDPTFIDTIAYAIRAFDWSGPAWTDRMTITRRPERTSFGAVSMQLRTAAQTLGMNPATTTSDQYNRLAALLAQDERNIAIVARHLRDLAERDGFDDDLPDLSQDQIRVIGARYNRGAGLSLAQIEQNTSYGDFIVRHWGRFERLVR